MLSIRCKAGYCMESFTQHTVKTMEQIYCLWLKITFDLSHVFEKGFTSANRNKANATGKGLYLLKNYAID